METSLHRALKDHYAAGGCPTEVRVGRYRIDVVRDDELIEIQHSALAAIRDKVAALLVDHRVRVVKPIVVTKQLVKRSRRRGCVVDRRLSPKRGRLLDVFDELVHFTRVFPHERLTLEVVLIDVEEWRVPGHGRRRRRREADFVVEDRKLAGIRAAHQFRQAADLAALVPADLPSPFTTADLAEVFGVRRHLAQQIAYCFRQMGAATVVGRSRSGVQYRLLHESGRDERVA